MSRLTRLFIPSADNQYAPHFLQRVAMLVMAILICFTFAISNIYSILWQYSDWMVAAVLPGVIVELTNDERSDEATTPLRRNAVLDEAARLKAEHMAENSYFSHYAPDGTTPWFWFTEAGYTYQHAGENLAIHFTDSSAVIDAWMKSPSHRENIVDTKFTEIGVGTARGEFEGFETVFVVQLFGTPQRAPALAVANEDSNEQAIPQETVLAEQTTEPEPEPIAEPEPEPAPMPEPVADTEQTSSPIPEPEPEEAPTSVAIAQAVPEPEPEPTSTPEPEVVEVTQPAVEEVAVSDDGSISVFSGTVTTTAEAFVPATVNTETPDTTRESNFFSRVLTQPSSVLGMLYMLLAAVVVLALMLSIFIEIRHQRPVQIAYGFALLLLMGGLYAVHMNLTNGVLIA